MRVRGCRWRLLTLGLFALILIAQLTLIRPALALGNSGDESYRALALPSSAPNDPLITGVRSVLFNPADSSASPFGWHDINGSPGREYTVTRGNNIWAATNVDNDLATIDPTGAANGTLFGGAGLLFDFPVDFNQDGALFRSAGVTNAFYVANTFHDVMYRHGFDEEAGNFQVNSYGRGGVAEPNGVLVVTQDPRSANRASFDVRPDGEDGTLILGMAVDPRGTAPPRDMAFANDVILHELGHGVSKRLTGGPTKSVDCLLNAEQAGEGWSDFFALVMTARASDVAGTPIGIGTWAPRFQPDRSSPGIRIAPYTTDISLNPFTYADMSGSATFKNPHRAGFVFGTALWEMYWNLVTRYGFNPNLYHSWQTGGNILALELVVGGLKFQPCSPGFVDSRDAILSADMSLTGGANQCLIWTAFAKRGLGYSASQGSADSTEDGTAAFDLSPAGCDPKIAVTRPAVSESVKDMVPPILSSLSLARSRFQAGRKVTLKYRLSEAATVRMTIKRKVNSRVAGTRTFQSLAGVNRKMFTGRVRRGGRIYLLRPGKYVAELVAVDSSGNRSKRHKVSFSIISE